MLAWNGINPKKWWLNERSELFALHALEALEEVWAHDHDVERFEVDQVAAAWRWNGEQVRRDP